MLHSVSFRYTVERGYSYRRDGGNRSRGSHKHKGHGGEEEEDCFLTVE